MIKPVSPAALPHWVSYRLLAICIVLGIVAVIAAMLSRPKPLPRGDPLPGPRPKPEPTPSVAQVNEELTELERLRKRTDTN